VTLRERIKDSNIWVVYAAIFTLGLAYGISLALIALFLDHLGYSKRDIGALAFWFALGVVGMSLPMDRLIRKFSARGTLIASLIGYAVAVSVFPLASSFEGRAALRVLDGACSVGIWVSCETILLSRANKENKALITSMYATSMAIGYILGPLAAKGIVLAFPMKVGFFVSGVFSLLAAGIVLGKLAGDIKGDALGKTDAEPASKGNTLEPRVPRSMLAILWRIKNACFATFAYGYFQASVVLFLPLYLVSRKGIPEDNTILIPAFFAAGMLLFSTVAGRLGDRYGHLALMRGLAVIGLLMILGFVFLDSFYAMCGAVFVAGASLASISPLSLALQGLQVEAHEYSQSNAVYNVFYAAGMLLGPVVSSRIFDAPKLAPDGGIVMLYHLAALWGAFVVFSLVFRSDDPHRSTS
jgi:MFS family permease